MDRVMMVQGKLRSAPRPATGTCAADAAESAANTISVALVEGSSGIGIPRTSMSRGEAAIPIAPDYR